MLIFEGYFRYNFNKQYKKYTNYNKTMSKKFGKKSEFDAAAAMHAQGRVDYFNVKTIHKKAQQN